MKKIIIAMAAIAAAFTMASCNKEQPVSPDENTTVGKSVITATIENDLTKAYLDANGNDTEGYKVFWSKGDNLLVGELDENGYFNNWLAEYKLEDSSTGSSNGTFSWHTGNTFIPLNESCQEPSFKRGTMYLATYPFDLAESENYDYLIWKTEQAYSETDRYIPMYAEAEGLENGTADFKFCNLGGMLRLTVKGSASIRSIKISAAEDEAMSGTCFISEDANGNMVGEISYELAEDFGDVFNYIILNCGDDGVALTEDGTAFYISMPCHIIYDDDDEMKVVGYSDVAITLTDTEGRTCVKKLNNKNGLVIERSKITTATFTASEFKENIPEGALPGKFSVSADKQVYFSQGNLTATVDAAGKPTTWKFAANQYDYLGEGGANKTIGTAVGDVDLFGWSTNAIKYGISTSTNENDYSGDFVDWGKNIGDGSTWRTLSKDEWVYLFETRTNASSLYKYGVTVCGKTNCVVIAPDGFTGTIETSYDATAWAIAEAAGLVCLPAAGRRYGPNVSYVGGSGHYWSSTARDSNYAYLVSFSSSAVSPGSYGLRNFGFSVRLITESN